MGSIGNKTSHLLLCFSLRIERMLEPAHHTVEGHSKPIYFCLSKRRGKAIVQVAGIGILYRLNHLIQRFKGPAKNWQIEHQTPRQSQNGQTNKN
ncbi:hypothetical protein D3C76_969440 [compost metagenome]